MAEPITWHYRLIATVTDASNFRALGLIALYHQWWEIEIAVLELKSTTLGRRALPARPPAGIEQEAYALSPPTRSCVWP